MPTEVKTPQSPVQTFQSPEVRVVEASAGSGKTFALAKRYVQLLLSPQLKLEQIPIRGILAITFTNKAAFEMKSRIFQILKQLALGNLPQYQQQEILAPIGLDAKAASQKAYQVMEAIIRTYNFFQVQTIDKFINALLSGCAFKTGLTANFRIKTNCFDYLERSLDELIDSAPSDRELKKVFEVFIHHYLYLENRTGWFPKQDMLAIVCHLFAKYNTYGLSFKKSAISAQELMKQKRFILDDLRELKSILPAGAHKGFASGLEQFLKNNTKGFDIDKVSDYFGRPEVPVKKDAEVPRSVDRLWTKVTGRLSSACVDEAYSLFNPYIDVFEHVVRHFYTLTSKDDILFLEELNKRAGSLFDEDYVTVEELYYRLATRFRHYLVDEFQDTSRLQWHNLEKMVEEALSTGGTLFYVGDRKQAIYAFRGGDVTLFEDVRGKFQPFNVRTEVLTNNWRSQKAIVEFNNHIFSMENLRRFVAAKEEHVIFSDEDWQRIEAIYQNARQAFRPENEGGSVRIEEIDLDRKNERNEFIRTKLIGRVKELRKRFACRDIAILTRDNKDVEQMTNWLLEEGILVDSERTSNIKENTLIQELIAFFKFLDSPIDNLSFANFILGDLFTQAAGVSRQEMHNFVFSLRSKLKGQKDFYLYTAFREQYFEVWEKFIEEFFKNVGLYPLYELAVSIYYRFGFLQGFPQAQGFLMHFLELIKKNEEEHADIESFLDYFEHLEGEDLYVPITDADAIKILTIHKAKGLQFPVVILPFLGMEVQVCASKENIQSYILKKNESDIELVRFKDKYRKFSEELAGLYAEEYKKAFLIELNNIYVALTRAQYEIHAFIPKRVGNNANLAKFLIPPEWFSVGEERDYPAPKKDESAVLQLPCSQYHDWIDYLKDEFQGLEELRFRRERLSGEIAHFLLSFAKNLKGQKSKEVLAQALSEARLRFTGVEDFTGPAEAAEKVLAAKGLRDIFHLDEKDGIFCEKEIVNERGETKRLDRLIIKDKEVWIIDYKSSRDTGAGYEEQVAEYARLIQPLYPQKSVRGFLVYLDEVVLEEVKCRAK